jgi:diguanylate cyclase (GGDEF)-like protein
VNKHTRRVQVPQPHADIEDEPTGVCMELLLRIDRLLAQALAQPGSSAQVAPAIVRAVCEPLGWTCGALWSRDDSAPDRLVCLGAWGIDTAAMRAHLDLMRGRRPILSTSSISGAAWLNAAPVWVADMAEDPQFRRVPATMRAGLRSALALPVAAGDQVLGVVEVCSTGVHARDERLLDGVRLLGGQIAQFLLRAQAQQQLADSQGRMRRLVALSSDWVWEQDDELRFTKVDGRGVTRSGAEMAPEMIGRRCWEVAGLVPASGEWDALRATLERRDALRDFACVYRDPEGRVLHISIHGEPTHDASGRFTGYCGTVRDLTLQRQAAQRIQYLATHDELTGLPNRATLRQLVNQAIELAKRYERRFAVFMLNIDRFKRMNDGLGREAADALLRELAARLRKHLRASDVVARLDGDEFAVLAHELLTPQHAEPIVRKLMEVVSEPLTIQGQDFRVSACIGVASYPQDAQDEPTLMKQAGLALRAAKKEGMDKFRFCERSIQGKVQQVL